jgi:hypothetical protein
MGAESSPSMQRILDLHDSIEAQSTTDLMFVTPLVLLSLKFEHNIMSITISCVCHT